VSLLFSNGPASPQVISIVVSILALTISVATAWLDQRGTVRMTQPTTIYCGADASASPLRKSIFGPCFTAQ
jgi:hypothetical protein